MSTVYLDLPVPAHQADHGDGDSEREYHYRSVSVDADGTVRAMELCEGDDMYTRHHGLTPEQVRRARALAADR